jgi:hypothetical protein
MNEKITKSEYTTIEGYTYILLSFFILNIVAIFFNFKIFMIVSQLLLLIVIFTSVLLLIKYKNKIME